MILAAQQQQQRLQQEQTAGEVVTIVGTGRIGSALADMAEMPVSVVKRGEKVESSAGPIVVCTRNEDLPAVLDATPKERWADLVFIQNGMIQPWLAERGLENNTQAVVYLSVSKLGEKPVDGKTDLNPEGLTAVNGKHAEAFASILKGGELACKVLDKNEYQKTMLEKLIWISAFMLIGVKHKCTVGEVEEKHRPEIISLVDELASAGSKALGIVLDDGMVDRLCAYARSVAHFPTAIKEFEWRNGWFYGLSQSAINAGQPDPCPLHSNLLKEVGAMP